MNQRLFDNPVVPVGGISPGPTKRSYTHREHIARLATEVLATAPIVAALLAS